MDIRTSISLTAFPLLASPPQVFLGVLREKEYEALTELIVRLALRGPFHLISCGGWLPDQDGIRRAVRRYTTAVDEILDHPILGRPATCLQLWDQLIMADSQDHPIFILNFLHHFYDPDVDLSLRQRTLEQCCQQVQRLARSRSVYVLVQHLPTEDYQRFLPFVASIADEILEVQEKSQSQALQYSLF
jgi:hypothetical protein